MTVVAEDELLLRWVSAADVMWDGEVWRLSSQAFNDREMKPSVDRKCLRTDPHDTKHEPSDGVAQLLTADIYVNVKLLTMPGAKPPAKVEYYSVRVIPRPIPEPANLAHAQIEAAPMVANGSHFKKLKEALCRITEQRPWVILPAKEL